MDTRILNKSVFIFSVHVVVEVEDEEKEPTYGAEEGESDEDLSPPTAGNSEGEGLHLSKKQLREARGQFLEGFFLYSFELKF